MSGPGKSIFDGSLEKFLFPIQEYLQDPAVTEILVNSFDEIFVERAGMLLRVPAKFNDEDALMAAVINIAQSVGRRIDHENPRLDARLPDGYRVHAVLYPIARKGTSISIRKFSKTEITMKQYLTFGAILPTPLNFWISA